jgi:HAD superfamily hydrolase (TIGR01509 family)
LGQRTAGAPGLARYQSERQAILERITPLEPMRGIEQLLRELKEAAVPAAVASTSPRSWVMSAAERIGILGHFEAIVCGDEVARRKPAPDVYLEAVSRLRVDPWMAVAIEDSAPGLESARAAGLTTVVIPHMLTASHDLGAADLRVAHAGELNPARLAALVLGGDRGRVDDCK